MLCPGRGSRAGGIGRFVDLTVSEAERLMPAIEFKVLDTRGSGHIALAPLFFARTLLQMAGFSVSRRHVVFHLNVAEHGSTVRKVVASWVAAVLRRPTVVHLHGADYGGFVRRLPGWAQRAIGGMFRRSAQVVTLGESWKRSVAESVNVPLQQIAVIPNGVKRRATNEAAVGSTTPADTPHILFLGRLEQRKGVSELIRALADPALRPLAWRATLAGDGNAAEFAAEAGRLGVADRITFPGWVSGDDVGRLLATATTLTLPSFAEGLPMAVIEGLAAGLPVVTTPVGSLPDFLDDERSVLFVTPGDVAQLAAALRRVLTEPETARRIGEAGRAVFERNFELTEITRNFLAIWTRCLQPA